ncbi:hypothetical protein BOTCAL_0159g00140 [Botryotinia calthae]|uniref:Uncharacterized protein n=1 Tax=Botryotinia calthae TaxID=38488 RepID=A0A4Y8D1W5_9HELO|nr:hypothetical protein BOTCAL_0159g00140 [Botryotinia calthae]
MSFEVFLFANGSCVEAVPNHQFVVEYFICQSSNRVDNKNFEDVEEANIIEMVNTGQGQVEMPYEPNKNCDVMLKS